jgi:regulator of sigma E protease
VDILYFALLVSILIFIHESGHFAFAKIFGVKVLTFSIGFGPKILRIRGKETEYCLGVLPFGGFVKMLEESKREGPIMPEDRHRTFESQALWKRIVIVLAGPAMNIVFPIVLFTSVFLEDREFLAPTVGVVLPGRPAEGKLMTGDRILSVDGTSVSSFPEVQRIVAKNGGKPVKMLVTREAKNIDVTVTPNEEIQSDEPEMRALGVVEKVGVIGIVPSFPAAVIGVPRVGTPAYRAGLRTFDRVTAINGRKIERFVDLIAALSQNKGETVVLTYMRPASVPKAMGGLCDVAVLEPGIATLTPTLRPPEAVPPADNDGRAADVLDRAGIETAEMYVAFVPEGSSEWKAGLRAGDRIVSLDGATQTSWKTMEDELVRGASRMHELKWTRMGDPEGGVFSLRSEQWDDELGQHYENYVFRTDHWMPKAPDEYVPNPSPIAYALRRGLEETGLVIRFISIWLLRLAQGKMSLKSVSGPITMYDIAGQAAAQGPTTFVWAMASVSIHLGLINLLPIPVLDGGHLFFFLVEGVRRRAVSIRVREIASLVGIVLLVLLMVVAFKNDLERHW